MKKYRVKDYDFNIEQIIEAKYEYEAVKIYIVNSSCKEYLEDLIKVSIEEGRKTDDEIFDPYNFGHWLCIELIKE